MESGTAKSHKTMAVRWIDAVRSTRNAIEGRKLLLSSGNVPAAKQQSHNEALFQKRTRLSKANACRCVPVQWLLSLASGFEAAVASHPDNSKKRLNVALRSIRRCFTIRTVGVAAVRICSPSGPFGCLLLRSQ